MTARLLRIALTLWTLVVAALSWGQMPPSPATWSATVEPANAAPGQRVELVLKAAVPSPWHLYSLTPIPDGPFPTMIAVAKGGAIAEVGKPVQAKPLKKLDPNFEKEVEYYEGSAEFRIPIRLAKTASGATKLQANVRFQLCNEGTCLPPTSDEDPVKVIGTVNVSGAAVNDTTPLDAAAPKTSESAQMPESPATWTATVEPANAVPGQRVELVLKAVVPAPWHLYSLTRIEEGPFPTMISVAKGGAITEVGKPVQGTPLKKLDQNFGKEVEYYEGGAEFRIPVRLSPTASGATPVQASVRFQLCNEGTCLPPTSDENPVKVTGTVNVSGAAVSDTTPIDAKPTAAASTGSDLDKAKAGGLLSYLGFAVLAGFGALVTPCVFPMIPITVSFFSKKKEGESAVKKATAYCFGIVGTFTALGILVSAIFGAAGLTTFANNPYLNLALAIVFVALAFSLFGFFEIGIPSSILTKLDSSGKTGLLGPILMGLTFSLTSFTCTLPFVGTVLVSASQGDYLWPIMGMVAWSGAFSLPFFLLALFPSALSKMPRSGAWLATVKAFMGFVELAAAVKFISSVDLGIVPGGLGFVTREVYLAVWFGVALLTSFFLLGVIKLPKVDDAKIGLFRRGLGVATLIGAGYLLLGINGKSIGELEAFLPPSDYGKKTTGKSDDGLAWISNYDEAVAKAKAEGKPLFVDFTGYYCTNCRWMEKNMFPKSEVQGRLKDYVLAKLYTDRGTPDDKRNQNLLKELTNSITLPAYVTFDGAGKHQSIEFTREQATFASFLDKGLGKVRTALR